MAKDPAFLFYSADFYMGTVGMTDAQVGQYIRLMCLQHQQGRLSDALVKSVLGNKPDMVVLAKFQEDENGLYYNVRLEKETEKRNTFVTSRRKNARQKQAYAADSDEHMVEHMPKHMVEHMVVQDDDTLSEHMPQHMENENENENKDTNTKGTQGGAGGRRDALETRFAKLWEQYPNKKGKPAAMAAYKRAIKGGVTDDVIAAGIRAYADYCQRTGTEARYIKHGSTWFNQGGWEDDYTVAQLTKRKYREVEHW